VRKSLRFNFWNALVKNFKLFSQTGMNEKGNIADLVAIAVAEVTGVKSYKKLNSGLQTIIVN